jgi:hypothetical protein
MKTMITILVSGFIIGLTAGIFAAISVGGDPVAAFLGGFFITITALGFALFVKAGLEI